MKKTSFFIVGAVNVDIIARTQSEAIIGDSNPGKVHISLGGVGANIARNLGLMGYDTHFLTVLANDSHLPFIQQQLQIAHVNLLASPFDKGNNSVYIATHDHTGKLIVSVNDMLISEQFSIDYLEQHWKHNHIADTIIIDTNLPAATIEYIATHKGNCTLVCDAVSCFKVTKLSPILNFIDVLKCNRQEAHILVNSVDLSDDQVVYGLLNKGIKTVLLTRGEKSILVGHNDQVVEFPVVPAKHIVSAIGAGDSFLAGFIASYIETNDMRSSVRDGMKLSRLCLLSEYAVNPMITKEWRSQNEVTDDN